MVCLVWWAGRFGNIAECWCEWLQNENGGGEESSLVWPRISEKWLFSRRHSLIKKILVFETTNSHFIFLGESCKTVSRMVDQVSWTHKLCFMVQFFWTNCNEKGDLWFYCLGTWPWVNGYPWDGFNNGIRQMALCALIKIESKERAKLIRMPFLCSKMCILQLAWGGMADRPILSLLLCYVSVFNMLNGWKRVREVGMTCFVYIRFGCFLLLFFIPCLSLNFERNNVQWLLKETVTFWKGSYAKLRWTSITRLLLVEKRNFILILLRFPISHKCLLIRLK